MPTQIVTPPRLRVAIVGEVLKLSWIYARP